MTHQGDPPAGIADIREAMDRRRRMGMGAVWPWYFALRPKLMGHSASTRDCSARRGSGLGEGNDERLYAAEVYRSAANYSFVSGRPDAAQAQTASRTL